MILWNYLEKRMPKQFLSENSSEMNEHEKNIIWRKFCGKKTKFFLLKKLAVKLTGGVKYSELEEII